MIARSSGFGVLIKSILSHVACQASPSSLSSHRSSITVEQPRILKGVKCAWMIIVEGFSFRFVLIWFVLSGLIFFLFERFVSACVYVSLYIFGPPPNEKFIVLIFVNQREEMFRLKEEKNMDCFFKEFKMRIDNNKNKTRKWIEWIKNAPSASNMRGMSKCFSATSNAVFKFSNGLSFDNRP